MKRYHTYKDSGIEWIGEVPEHWEVKRLKYVATINPSKENSKISKDSDELVTFLPMEKVNEDGTFAADFKRPINELWNGFTYFKELDTIFAKITPCFENGKGAYLINLGSSVGFGSTEFHVLREIVNTSISKYLYYITRFDLFRKTGESLMIGVAGQKRVPSTFAENFLIGIPPVLEQQSITAYLDRKTAQIDNIISKKQKLIELLKEERAAIINQAVTKGLNPDAPMKDSGVEWIGEVPEKWEVKRLRYVAKTVQTGTTPSSLKPEYFIDGEIDWFTPVDFGDSLFLSNSNRKLNRLAIDDNVARLYGSNTVLLVGIGATLGKVGIIKRTASSNQQINAISFKDDYNPDFGAYYFQAISDIIVSMSNAATLPILNQTQTKEIMTPVPPQKEQNEIVGFINQTATKIDQTIFKIEKQIALLKEFRTALISEAVTGKIDVRDEELK